jgi:HK97 family phage portal protein
MIVESGGTFQAMTAAPRAGVGTGLPYTGSPLNRSGFTQAYGEIYRTQPNVRIVIDFLAMNLAQLGLPAYRRVSDTDRERLPADHPLVYTIAHPNRFTTRYRLISDLMTDMGIYFNAYWLKVRPVNAPQLGLFRLPPEQVEVEGGLLPRAYYWTQPYGETLEYGPEDVIHFSGYGTSFKPFMGISPMETLRQVLAEDQAAADYRANLWRTGARIDGVLTRAKDSPAARLSDTQVASFREQWRTRYTGQTGGGTPILPAGMDLKTVSFSSRDSEFIAGGKLRREVVTNMYHVPPTMIGDLEHATYSNVREQRKQLYADVLPPWCEMYQSELELHLVHEFADTSDVYLEFNLAEKLKGDFEEQAASLQLMVGRPLMTLNEGRARVNLPSIKDDPSADKVALPLNMSPSGSTPALTPTGDTPAPAAAAVLIARRTWDRQLARLQKMPMAARAAAFDDARWNRELAADLAPLYHQLGFDGDQAARRSLASAQKVNRHTRALLEANNPIFEPPPDGILTLEGV